MATTVTYTASMRTRKTDSASNFLNSAASQEYYRSGEEYVGIVHFAGLNMSGKVIKNMVLTVTSARAGYGASTSKTVYVRKSAYQAASQSGITGLDYKGDALGTFTGSFFGNTMSYTFNSTTNASLFSALATYFQAGTESEPNNTITLYNPNPPSSTMGYSQNYLQWNAATLEVTYEEGISEPTTSAASVEIGTAVQIFTNRRSENALHTISYSFAGQTGTIGTVKSVAASITWTPSMDLINSITNAVSGVCTITCQTYYGNNLAGTKTCTLVLTVPDSIKPRITSTSIQEAVPGIYNHFWAYIRTKSKLSVSISSSGSYGSTITAWRSVINGMSYTTSSFTTGFLNIAGTNVLSVTVTDSRGRTDTKTYDISVVDYSPATISLFTAERCNSSGTAPQSDGVNVRVSITGTFGYEEPREDFSCSIHYKRSSDPAWIFLMYVPISYNHVNQTNLLLSGTFDVLTSYDFKVTLSDYFTTIDQRVTISTKQVVLDFLGSGNGIAFGKIAENANKAEFGWPLKLSTPLAVTEGGTGGTTVAGARNALGLGNTSGALPLANGGTGGTTKATACSGIGALPVAGGTMGSSAQIQRNVYGGQWKYSRDRALIRTVGEPNDSSFYPSIAMKTPLGVWAIGTVGEDLAFARTTDANYEAGNNTPLPARYIRTDGNFSGKAENVTGTVAIANGGTGATTVLGALANLGIAIKTGTILVGTGGATVTFDVPFDSVPYVITTGSNNGAISIHTVDVNGFVIRSSVNQNNVRWLALTFPTN